MKVKYSNRVEVKSRHSILTWVNNTDTIIFFEPPFLQFENSPSLLITNLGRHKCQYMKLIQYMPCQLAKAATQGRLCAFLCHNWYVKASFFCVCMNVVGGVGWRWMELAWPLLPMVILAWMFKNQGLLLSISLSRTFFFKTRICACDRLKY